MKFNRVILVIIFVQLSNIINAQNALAWIKKTPIPSTAIISSGYFKIDSTYYIIGGDDSLYNDCKGVWGYNILSDTWQNLRDFSFGTTTELTAFAINGKGYICTGLDSIAGYGCDTLMWQYDPTSDSWSSRASFPGSKREKASSFTYKNKAYVGLGYACGGPVTDLWEYDPLADSWSMRDSLPTVGRYGSALAIIDSIAYLIGGIDNNAIVYSEMWSYNIISDQWRQLANIPGGARRYPVVFSFDTFFLAGYGDLDSGVLHYAHDLYKYDIANDKWDTLVSLNLLNGVVGNSSFVYGQNAYFFAGVINDTIFSRDMWTADASSLFHESKDTTGIAAVNQDPSFSVYPNPVSRDKGFSISTSESGEVIFTDELGRTLDDRKLNRGINSIKLATDDEVVFYHSTLRDGTIKNGKVILY
jgi:hypothetical protein